MKKTPIVAAIFGICLFATSCSSEEKSEKKESSEKQTEKPEENIEKDAGRGQNVYAGIYEADFLHELEIKERIELSGPGECLTGTFTVFHLKTEGGNDWIESSSLGIMQACPENDKLILGFDDGTSKIFKWADDAPANSVLIEVNDKGVPVENPLYRVSKYARK